MMTQTISPPESNVVTVYTMDRCPFCERAKALLKTRGISFREIRVDEEDDLAWNWLYELSGMRTVPQIFNGLVLIGGFQELQALDQKTSLKEFSH